MRKPRASVGLTAIRPRPAGLADGVVSAFALGLGAASLFVAHALPRPQGERRTVASDWQAVGRDLAAALHGYDRDRLDQHHGD